MGLPLECFGARFCSSAFSGFPNEFSSKETVPCYNGAAQNFRLRKEPMNTFMGFSPQVAISFAQGAIAKLEPLGPSVNLVKAYLDLAAVHTFGMDSRQSASVLEKAELVCSRLTGLDHDLWLGKVMCEKASAISDLGRFDEAIDLLRRSIELGLKTLNRWDLDLASRYTLLGELLTFEKQDYAGACLCYSQGLKILEHKGVDRSPGAITSLTVYAYALINAGDFSLAKRMVDRARSAVQRFPVGEPMIDAMILESMAIETYYLWRSNNRDGAAQALFAASQFVRRSNASSSPMSSIAAEWITTVASDLGLLDLAAGITGSMAQATDTDQWLSNQARENYVAGLNLKTAILYLAKRDFPNALVALEDSFRENRDRIANSPDAGSLLKRYMAAAHLGMKNIDEAYKVARQAADIPGQSPQSLLCALSFAYILATFAAPEEAQTLEQRMAGPVDEAQDPAEVFFWLHDLPRHLGLEFEFEYPM